MKRRRSKHRKVEPVKTVVGIGWYNPEQWQRLREVAVDREDLHDTYAEWETELNEAIQHLEAVGMSPLKIEVNVDELVEWCAAQQQKLDGEARSRFIAGKTRDLNLSRK